MCGCGYLPLDEGGVAGEPQEGVGGAERAENRGWRGLEGVELRRSLESDGNFSPCSFFSLFFSLSVPPCSLSPPFALVLALGLLLRLPLAAIRPRLASWPGD